jgi:hypothetical protein
LEGLFSAAPNLLEFLNRAGSSLPAWFWPAACSGRWHRMEKLPVAGHVAISTEDHKIAGSIVALLAPLDPVVHLQVLQLPALLPSPAVPLQYSLHQSPVGLPSRLEPLYLPLHSELPECRPPSIAGPGPASSSGNMGQGKKVWKGVNHSIPRPLQCLLARKRAARTNAAGSVQKP